METALMRLEVLLPHAVFADLQDVRRIVVRTRGGSLGLLPHRLDCVTSLAPGILTYETARAGEAFLAVDEGVLVKTGLDVTVAVRGAIGGADLGRLSKAVENQFLHLDERERNVRSVLAKLESSLIRRFAELHHG
jgi:F-type H+-transporting ATPase subunit epsilon